MEARVNSTLPTTTPDRTRRANTGGRHELDLLKTVLQATAVDSGQTSPIVAADLEVQQDAPRSPKGRAGWCEASPGRTEGKTAAKKRSRGGDVRSVVLGAQGEPCTACNPAIVTAKTKGYALLVPHLPENGRAFLHALCLE